MECASLEQLEIQPGFDQDRTGVVVAGRNEFIFRWCSGLEASALA